MTTRTTNPDRGRDRADAEGLIPIADHWELHCRECGYRDRDAYAVGVCPFCGGARAGPRLPPIEELLEELLASGLDVSDVAQEIGVSSATVYNWRKGDFEAPNHSTHERLAQYHSDRCRDTTVASEDSQ